jgi:hypothetical protein
MLTIAMAVGLVNSLLASHIRLSIYLLVQKNSTKLENLLLKVWTGQRGKPYSSLTIGSNVVLVIAGGAYFVRATIWAFLENTFRNSTAAPCCRLYCWSGHFVLVICVTSATAQEHQKLKRRE